jgi:hypothetical protein
VASHAAGEGFLSGLNDVLALGALLSLAGAVLTLWLVREREIERQPSETEAMRSRYPSFCPSGPRR